MQITSFQKAVLAVGSGIAVIGGGITLGKLRAQRRREEEAAYVATPVSVDDFVTRTIDAFDTGTWGSPLEQRAGEDYQREGTTDGRINLGVEDTVRHDRAFFREIVDLKGDGGYSSVISGREFLRAADANQDGQVTKEELTAAVRPYAGSDGRLDEGERRTVLVERGLGAVVDQSRLAKIDGWGNQYGEGPRTAADAAAEVLRDIRVTGEQKPGTKPDPRGVPIDRIAPSIPWGSYSQALASGDISSMTPAAAKVDEAGDGDGYMSPRELATWIADSFKGSDLLYGHVEATKEQILERLSAQRIARVDATTLRGRLYYEKGLPKADVERFYGGDVRAYVDGIKGFKQARGDAPWEPDPLSGKPSPKPSEQGG